MNCLIGLLALVLEVICHSPCQKVCRILEGKDKMYNCFDHTIHETQLKFCAVVLVNTMHQK